jgi:energy-coupling factor transport system substrate-specific component
MAFGIASNLIIGQLTSLLKVPLYLDSIGTVLVAVLCGPWAACLTGALANLLAAAFGSPAMPFFIPVALVIAVQTAFVARHGLFRSIPRALIAGALLGIVTAALSAPIAAYVFGGTMMAGTDLLVIFYRSLGYDLLRSTFFQGLTSDPLDKAVTYLLVLLVLRSLPMRILNRFRSATADRIRGS